MYYGVFTDVFKQIHMKMKEVDPYFRKYSSNVLLAGSHYDRTRVTKPDEFDVAIVIGLPLDEGNNTEDIILEPKEAGFVQLRMGTQHKQLMMQNSNAGQINRQACAWIDESNFLLRSKFMDWFKGVVDKALNLFNYGYAPIIYSGGVPYTIRRSESGPARTLYIENISKGFKLDVDLVPAVKLPQARWPITDSYRPIRANWSTDEKFWMVVPKLNKNANNDFDAARSWRMNLQLQERMMMNNSENLRQVIRLLKRLRDARDMEKISSYYLKNLVLWEIMERENESNFWTQSPADLFKIMVRKLYYALKAGKIPYFWNNKDDLLANVHPATINGYAAQLERLVKVLEDPSMYKHVAKYLMTSGEFADYNNKFLRINTI